MSYVRVSRDGRFVFGHAITNGSEHPITTILRWNREYGEKDGTKHALLSFQPISDHSVPNDDIETYGIGP
jgi:hypothetical protein